MGRAFAKPIEPRLLNRSEAATYCGMDPVLFERVCPVRPISLADDLSRNDKRLNRWDVILLDEWIDRLGGRAVVHESKDWLSQVD
jgi:hypothetical protein